MEKQTEYLSSLKSIETENLIDLLFYRPIGFFFARKLVGTGVTPNMITILSIFVGLGAGLCFLNDGQWEWIACGILCLIIANIMDCVDGQLARLSGIKSEIGRILDGFAGDLWFACIYICFMVVLVRQHPILWGIDSSSIFIGLGILSGLSHLIQANLTDYYKTIHLFFISPEKGKELETSSEIQIRIKNMKPGVNRFFSNLYYYYTRLQELFTPNMQKFLKILHLRYGKDIPEDIRIDYRKSSSRIMKRWVDLLTFNGRTIPLFVIVILNQYWIYFIFEIVFLGSVLIVSVWQYERLTKRLLKERL